MSSLRNLAARMGLKKAENAKSLTYFSPNAAISVVSEELIAGIYAECIARKESVRVCLHTDPSDDLHNMIIAHPKCAKIRPHANLAKSKTYHLLHGSMLVGGYDKHGNELFRICLSEENIKIFRIHRGIFLVLIPLSEAVVFHEITFGKFIRERDSIFADFDDEPLRESLLKGYKS